MTTMNALIQPAWGSPDVLTLTQVPQPTLRDGAVLVRVRAAALNKGDWHLLTGTPYLLRLMGYGLAAPRVPIPGCAVAGQVEAVGAGVTGLRVGDEVFGEIARGGFAEYATVDETALAKIPAGMSFATAATIPIAGTTALQGLRDAGKVQPGQSVLIQGASGGVGTFAVQIAVAMGAKVTAVCSARNGELVRGLGASAVIDYAQTDFTTAGERYDVIFDLIGDHSVAACRRALTPTGRYLSAAGGAENMIVGPMLRVLLGMMSNLTSRQPFVPVVAMPNREDLAQVAAMVAAGTVTPVLDRTVTLREVPDAMRALGLGHTRGKIAITL